MPSGTLTKKIARQPSPAISRPPSEGPRAVPIADIVPSSPMALPVLAFGTVSPTNAMVRAIMIAAPRPCAARAAISSQSAGAAPHTAEATVNRRVPTNSSRRRPVTVTEPSDADDQRSDGEKIGEDDPLDLLEGGRERLGQSWQADVGDAGAERGQQHGQRKADERPPHRGCPFRTSSDCLDSSCIDRLHMNSVFWRLPKGSCQQRSPLPDMAEDASICTLFLRLTPCRDQSLLWLMHVDTRSELACHP